MQYAKLQSGYLHYAPSTVEWQGHVVNNPDENKLKELGYLPVKYVDMPTNAPQGQHYESEWVQTAKEIKQIWNLVKDEPIPSMPPTLEEEVATLKKNNETLTQCILEMSMLVYK